VASAVLGDLDLDLREVTVDHQRTVVIHLRAFGFVGTIDVWRVPHDMHGDYGELFRQLQAQQRELPG
jgi:hypothetical protein